MLQIAAVLVCFFGLTLALHSEFGRERTLDDDYDKWITSSPPSTGSSHYQPIKPIDESTKDKSNNDYNNYYSKRITWSPPTTDSNHFQQPIDLAHVSTNVKSNNDHSNDYNKRITWSPPTKDSNHFKQPIDLADISTNVKRNNDHNIWIYWSPQTTGSSDFQPIKPDVWNKVPTLTPVLIKVPPESPVSTKVLPASPVSTKVQRYSLFHLRMNWYNAIGQCSLMGLRLAIINDLEEYNELVKQIKKEGGANREVDGYWIAGSDLGVKGTYKWLTTGRPLNFTKWYKDQPNHSQWNGEVNHCIELQNKFDYYMNDQHCSESKFVVCESVI